MKIILKITSHLLFLCLTSCNGQISNKNEANINGDTNENLPFYINIPDKIYSTDTSPGWNYDGKKITLTGTVYQLDSKTPATNVILYYYQTNTSGIYELKESSERNMPKNKMGHSHGHIRGWIKTDANGKYTIKTIMPGSYPGRDEAAHIHISVKEPNMKDIYYLDDFVFDSDKLLTTKRRIELESRGGSGVMRFVEDKGNLIGERDIILGLNIPNYPKQNIENSNSGKNIGEDIISFTPFHAFGADKGTKTCPICKYGWFHGILYFVGNYPEWDDVKKWLSFLDSESIEREKYLKVYFIYGNEANYNKDERLKELEKLGNELNLQKVALTYVPSFNDKDSEIYLNEINPKVDNTFFIYKRSRIIDKYVDLKPTDENFNKIKKILDASSNKIFDLSKMKK